MSGKDVKGERFVFGVDISKNGDLSALTIVSERDTLQDLALAMLAGARAIETSRRCVGAIYVRGRCWPGERGAPQELSYYKAAEMLRMQGERLLEDLKGV